MPRFHRELAGLATDYVRAKRRTLQQGTPQTVTDSGGTVNQYSWQGQDLDRAELRKARDMRQSGGVVAFLFESKATMRFGTGAELQSENEDLEAWLNDQFAPVDLLTLDLGADATWYPYGLGEIVETRGGEFSHIEPIEPWTMLPQTDDHGDIVVWEQQTQGDRSRDPTPFDPDEIGSITLNKAAARDRVGVSEVLRSEEEITQYKQNQRAVDKAIEVAGFPHHVWTVGSEGRSPVDDTDLRRVRNLIDDMDGDTQFVVGPDVDHDKITAADFDFENVTKRDLRKLTTAVGLPMEIAGYGREGLGSGSEAALVTDMLALQNEVARRRFEAQFITEFVEPVVRRYSPFDADAEDIGLHIPAFLDDTDELAELITKVGEYMSTAEVRERLDLPPLEDDDKSEAFRSPQQVEEAEEDDPAAQQPAGGLFGSAGDTDFRDGRALQEVPDNAVSIDDPSEAPDGASTIRGPGGGLYYIPAGEGGGGGDGDAGDIDTVESPNAEKMRELAAEVDPPTDAAAANELQSELFDTLTEEYGGDGSVENPHVVIGRNRKPPDGDHQFSMHKAFNAWESGGYWSSSTAPIWAATRDASDGDPEVPVTLESDEPVTQRDTYVDGVEDAVKDVIAFSQAFVQEHMDGESVTVSRGIKDDLAEQAREAKKNGEPLEIEPRAMESWSTDEEAAADWGEVTVERDLSPDDVAFYGPAAIPQEFDDQEITALGNDTYEIDPDNIQISD